MWISAPVYVVGTVAMSEAPDTGPPPAGETEAVTEVNIRVTGETEAVTEIAKVMGEAVAAQPPVVSKQGSWTRKTGNAIL